MERKRDESSSSQIKSPPPPPSSSHQRQKSPSSTNAAYEEDETTGGGNIARIPSSGSHLDIPLMRVCHASAVAKNTALGYPANVISNTKYTWWNFLPKNFAEQFSLHMNRYFLLIACLQLVSILTPVNPLTTWGPLLVIFCITATREAIDDYHRGRDDKKANERLYTVIRNQEKVQLESHHIQVGDILFIKDGEEFPADLFLLQSSNKNGSIFIQTSNLDGETNYKQRQVLPECMALDMPAVHAFSGVIECAQPNAHVYKFDSRLWMQPSVGLDAPESAPISVTGDQLLQQTTRLVNTDWIYGVVVYTGNETKFGMNRGEPPFKLAKVDAFINKVAIVIFVFQLVLVVVFGIIGDVLRYHYASKHWYLDYPNNDAWYMYLVIPVRFLLLNSTMIPISLKVTLDLCKMIYAKFLGEDLGMYDAVTGQPAYAKTTAICEDLGQIEYVLTDKTGTLTQNSMIFKECSVGKVMYSANECQPDGHFHQKVKRGEEPVELLRHFCLNNGVVPVRDNATGVYSYKGSSPDEVALIKAAHDFGVKLVFREGKNVTLEVLGKVEKYVILEELRFTSDRRRMSVVVLNNDTKEIKLYMKGADDVVAKRTVTKDTVRVGLEHVEVFAKKGLRTLFFASRHVDSQEFKVWKDEWQRANTEIVNREEALSAVYEKLENNFTYQGCTAIEDELQVGVADTIHLLREAGIKIWMLTGDKFSTALQIATSCNLRSPDERSQLYAIEGKKLGDVKPVLEAALSDSEHTTKEITVIIRGVTLLMVLKYFKDEFTTLALRAHTVICCRVTPAQKAELVHLVRGAGKLTLAIGDGGNDVAMIQQAHVGVGIRGKEGLQAARAADYTISYFGALERLILVHGRYAYLRTSLVAQYSFYKSLLFCFIQIGFGFVSYFSGATLFNSLCITIYNAALFVPIVSFVFDKDVGFNSVLQYPQLYRDNQRSVQFNFGTFAFWALRAVMQAYIIFFITIWSRGQEYHSQDGGHASDWETLGLVAFTAYLWLQGVTMMLELKNLTYVSMVAIWGMHAITFLILIFTNALLVFDSLNGYWAVFVALADGQTWLHNLLCVVACCAPVIAAQYQQVNYSPTVIDHLRYRERLMKKKSSRQIGSVDSNSELLGDGEDVESKNNNNNNDPKDRRWSLRVSRHQRASGATNTSSVEMKET